MVLKSWLSSRLFFIDRARSENPPPNFCCTCEMPTVTGIRAGAFGIAMDAALGLTEVAQPANSSREKHQPVGITSFMREMCNRRELLLPSTKASEAQRLMRPNVRAHSRGAR